MSTYGPHILPAHDARTARTDSDRLGQSLHILRGVPNALPLIAVENDLAVCQLEKIMIEMVDAINKHDWTHPHWCRYLSEDIKASFEHLAQESIKGREAWLDMWSKYRAANPLYHSEILSSSTNLSSSRTHADVWLLIRVTGHGSNIQRENVTLTQWRWRDGHWIAYNQVGYRSGGIV